ncbi:AGC protein kinase [Edhazardia aedis USNM 41457]|uniref:protein kinase C n=1 Tax=Edhazardia aedis (strain USNM 41457) TaxID=1003232 RepID=J9D6I5_EDHAE|nr:AGC protein kinase [Edhazardia aedis USNM 41457]|eukprot:EJW03124.1 AGC protein kinase [Edhazardia aedis USNM 41457]
MEDEELAEKTLKALKNVLKFAKGADKATIEYRINELETRHERAKEIHFNYQVPRKRIEEKIYKETSIMNVIKKTLAEEGSKNEELNSKLRLLENKLFFLNNQLDTVDRSDIKIDFHAITGTVKFTIEEISINPAFTCRSIQFFIDDIEQESILPDFTGELAFKMRRNYEFEMILHGNGETIISMAFFPCQFFLDQNGRYVQRMQFNDAFIKLKILFVKEGGLMRQNAKIMRVVKFGHVLEDFNKVAPYYCCVCNKLGNLFSHAYRCVSCRFTCHKMCSDHILFFCPLAPKEKEYYHKGYNIPHCLKPKLSLGLSWCIHCGCRIEAAGDCFKCFRCNVFVHGECEKFVFPACLIDEKYRFAISQYNPPPPIYAPTRDGTQLSDFKLLKVLGRGSFGKVFLAKHIEHKRIVALKTLKKENLINSNEVAYLEFERKTLFFASHSNCPYLMKMYYCFQDDRYIYFGTELLPGGDLFHHISKRKFTHSEIKIYACEILSGLGYLHQNNIIYRDMKLDNLLLTDKGHIKIVDFGLAKDGIGPNDETFTYCGTLDTIAPEVVSNEGYTRAADWYSYGVVLYELYECEPVFDGETIEQINNSILHDTPKFTEKTPEDAKDLISKLLEKDPKKRIGYGVGDHKDIAKHEYFKNIDWNVINSCQHDAEFIPDTNIEANFDEEYTAENVTLSPCKPSTQYDHYFVNFR